MAAAIPYMAMVSPVMQAYGAIRASQAEAAAARYNEEVGKSNAASAEAQGEAAAQQMERDTRRKLGAMMAGYGASGVQLADGSPADVLADSARSAALDRLTMKYNYKMRALGYTNQANLDAMGADRAIEEGRMRAASILLSSSSYTKFGA